MPPNRYQSCEKFTFLEQVSQNLGISFLSIYPTKFNQIIGGESIRVHEQILVKISFNNASYNKRKIALCSACMAHN